MGFITRWIRSFFLGTLARKIATATVSAIAALALAYGTKTDTVDKFKESAPVVIEDVLRGGATQGLDLLEKK